jgi:hypothetical protein
VRHRHRRGALVLALAAVVLYGPRARAHDVPLDVLVQAFVKPEPGRLRLLIRAPLSGMLDVEYPVFGPGYLDIDRAEPALRTAAKLWLIDYLTVYENGRRVPDPTIAAVRVSLPSDKAFADYEQALAHLLTGPRLTSAAELYWNQGLLDVLLEYPIEEPQSEFALQPAFERLGIRVTTTLRVLLPDGTVRAFQFRGNPGLVRLDPRWHQAALTFVRFGFDHILDGIDHLLFLLCLVIPVRRLRTLVVIVTSFTAAHSITLIGSALGLAPDALWFPPLVETLIAGSILYMALENIVAARTIAHRWLVAFLFGLVHGFGFSFALRETLQFAGAHLLTSLVAFNLGVELGQLLVLVLLVPALGALFRRVVDERIGTILLSAFVAHTAWHWLGERWAQLRQFPFPWPMADAARLAKTLRWMLALVVIALGLWLARLLRDWLRARRAAPGGPSGGPPRAEGEPAARLPL